MGCKVSDQSQALTNIDGIIAKSQALMVARGDLGVELGLNRVPFAQKLLIARAKQAGLFAAQLHITPLGCLCPLVPIELCQTDIGSGDQCHPGRGEHDQESSAHPSRGQRRLQCRVGWSRCISAMASTIPFSLFSFVQLQLFLLMVWL